ncbi:endonuclease [Ferruginibacter lapsinanis]|uniref:endonuclease n=1 Tax=Ferruginibacter lapsinanis TaxID=563172 RepID=UPI001E33CA2F|nr:endonuclease [Ferruginibacter lapsinanis]UEG50205.1 endonuclease [Ferruginibacter lapsinanis]
MKKILHFVALFLTVLTFSAKSQVVITNTITPYTQDFNTLASTGATGSAMPSGWTFLETGSGSPNTTYGVDAGGASSGNTYSYGAASNSERALGSLTSGSLHSVYGVSFTNNTGSILTSITVTYVGEQWRLGANSGRLDTLNFQYSTDATSLSSGTWTDENNLDFTSPKTSGTVGALDGNAAGNKTAVTFTISGLNITNGTTFWFRWDDVDATGADDGLSIDDVAITFGSVATPACAEPAAQPTALLLTPSPTSISGSFTAPVTTPDQYLVVRSTSNSLSASPVDATTYTVGQSFGGGSVVFVGSATNFSDAGLSSSTLYYYFVFAFNSEDCLNGPNYLSTAPLTNNVSTLALPACTTPAASPTVLNLTPSNNTILGSFTASATANRYLIVRSTSSSLSVNPTNGTTYATNQTLGNGVVVDYTSNTSFVANGLTVGTKYYFYVFAANADCNGAPFYRTTTPLTGNTTTTNTATGIPAGYYNAATGLTCASLKTALKTIISANTTQLTYTPGVWNAINSIDKHRNDANTADIIWDIYTDNPTAAEVYTFTPITDQCGTYSKEGDCYNREHSFPREWFGGNVYPMYSDIHHIFPVDGWVNGKHDSNPYGEVTSPTFTSISNKSKLGPNTTGCYTGTVFEPVDAYKGDIARAQLYMITRYQDSMVKWKNNGLADAALNGTTYPSLDDWYIQLLLKWHHLDPVSQKEIDRNNAIYALQGNRNPFVDVPSFADDMFSCVTFSCIIPVKLIDFSAVKNTKNISLNWSANAEVGFKNYQVERSIDGANFYAIGNIPAQNLSNYSFEDNALTGANLIVYYRLKMIDIDGRASFSKIVSVRLDNTVKATLIYPNPARDVLTIKLLQNLKANSILTITDAIGRTIMQKNVTTTQNIIPLNIQTLAAGKYFVTIKNEGELIHQSFVKIK